MLKKMIVNYCFGVVLGYVKQGQIEVKDNEILQNLYITRQTLEAILEGFKSEN